MHDGYFGEPHYFALDGLEVGRYTVSFSTGAIDSIHALLAERFDNSQIWMTRLAADGPGLWPEQLHLRRPFGQGRDLLRCKSELRDPLRSALYQRRRRRRLYRDTGGGPAQPEGRRTGGGRQRSRVEHRSYSGYGSYMLFYSVDLEDGETYQVDVEGKDTCNDCTMDRTMLGHIQATRRQLRG